MHLFMSDSLRIAYLDCPPHPPQKDTPPVLLIHGFASNHAVNWKQTLWIDYLTHHGYRVLVLDNRGHGQSDKLYDSALYAAPLMAQDARRLLDHLGIEVADVMGYSMGARIAAFLAVSDPLRVRRLVLGGLGHHLIHGEGLPLSIAEALEAPSLNDLTHPMQRMFRRFAERTQSDLKALAACIRGSRQSLTEADVRTIHIPTLVAVGTKDEIAGDPHLLADLFPLGRALPIEGRDHHLAVGDKVYKAGVLAFLGETYT